MVIKHYKLKKFIQSLIFIKKMQLDQGWRARSFNQSLDKAVNDLITTRIGRNYFYVI